MLPTKLRSERCANDLNHFQLKVPSGTFSIAEIMLCINLVKLLKNYIFKVKAKKS